MVKGGSADCWLTRADVRELAGVVGMEAYLARAGASSLGRGLRSSADRLELCGRVQVELRKLQAGLVGTFAVSDVGFLGTLCCGTGRWELAKRLPLAVKHGVSVVMRGV